MKEIPLTQGKIAIVDDADYERLSKFKWCVNGRGYAETWMKTRLVRMHRFIMGENKTQEVDHIDGNKLNNSRANLRFCSHSQNARNGSSHKDSSSCYKGVSWDKSRNLYEACIFLNGHKKYLGRFSDEKEAALAYDRAALENYGEFARLNKIQQENASC